MEPEDPRKVLRHRLLAVRAACASDAAQVAALAQQVAAWLAPRRERVLALYWPVRGEPDLRPVAAAWAAVHAQRRCALPVIDGPRLRFAPWKPGAPMQAGRYGIAVPEAAATLQPELLLIPCVGFDAAGIRLGYGGGYYDRTLAHWPAPQPLAVGIAFAATAVDDLAPHPGDAPMDLILTERGPAPRTRPTGRA